MFNFGGGVGVWPLLAISGRPRRSLPPQRTETPRERAGRGGANASHWLDSWAWPSSSHPIGRREKSSPPGSPGRTRNCQRHAEFGCARSGPARRWAGPGGGARSAASRFRLRGRRTGWVCDGRSPVPTLDPPALRSPPRWGLRSPRPQGTHPGLSRRGRGAFRSPRPSPKAAQADGASRGSLHLDVERLREARDSLEREIAQLLSDGLCVEELDEHISRLHEYNDIKDVGQMLLGKLAVLRGVTTKELYAEFDLDLSD